MQELLACFSQSLHLKAFVCSEHFGRSCFPLPNHVCCVHPVARTFSASYFVVCSCCSESSALSFANSFYLLFLCLHPTFSWSCLNHKNQLFHPCWLDFSIITQLPTNNCILIICFVLASHCLVSLHAIHSIRLWWTVRTVAIAIQYLQAIRIVTSPPSAADKIHIVASTSLKTDPQHQASCLVFILYTTGSHTTQLSIYQ